MMRFNTKLHGIPCQCDVTHYRPGEAAYTEGHPDRWEPAIDPEFEFDILDTRGRQAPWLERYLTKEDHQRLYEEFKQELYITTRAEDYEHRCF
jgi:hypothetical protein